MMRIDFIRHGAKQLVVEHKTGYEALLSEIGIEQIKNYAKVLASVVSRYENIQIISSPVERAKATAKIIRDQLSISGIEESRIGDLIINPGFSSYDLKDGELINLSSPEMSKIWAEAKIKRSNPSEREAQLEDESLRAWLAIGLDGSPGTGISLRGLCNRLVSSLHKYIEDSLKADNDTYTLIIGHSGDIEPFAYYLKGILQNDTLEDPFLESMYDSMFTALAPLSGVAFYGDSESLTFAYPKNGSLGDMVSLSYDLSIVNGYLESQKEFED